MVINFIFHDSFLKVGDRKRLKRYIESLFYREGKPLSLLTYIFCTDQYLLSINKEFLKHDDYTDIITFCLSEPCEPIIGEIYISVDRIRENARVLGVSIEQELHRVVFHGALHLCGYNDKKPADKTRMTQEEDKNLSQYFG